MSKYINGQKIIDAVFEGGLVGNPSVRFANSLLDGFYRIGTNNIGLALNAVKTIDFAPTNTTFSTLNSFSTGVAITAGSYQIGRDADATNQLHHNVPTGASFEWSVNDVEVMKLTSTSLSVPSGLLIGGVALKSTADTNWYIDPVAGNDTTGDGSIGSPWQTRQKAYSMLPDVIAHKYTIYLLSTGIHFATTTPELSGKFITTNGAVTIKGSTTNILTGQIATGGVQIDASGYGTLVKAAAGWGVGAYNNYWVKITVANTVSAIIYEKYLKIISNTADTIYTTPLRFTPVNAVTTFDIVSFDTTISGALSGTPNTVHHYTEKLTNMQVASDVWYDGLYAMKGVTYEALNWQNGYWFSLYTSQVNALVTGAKFDITDATASASLYHVYLFAAGSYLNLAGIYTTGYSATLCYVQEGSILNAQDTWEDYTTTSAGVGQVIQTTSGGSVYFKDFYVKGDVTHPIIDVTYGSGSGSYILVTRGRVEYATNIFRSLSNGLVDSGSNNVIYGANNTNLYNLTNIGAGRYRPQASAGYSNLFIVDDSSILYGVSTDAYAIKELIKAQTGIVAGSTIPLGYVQQSLTAVAPTTLTSTPTIATGLFNGQKMSLIGTSDVNTITVQDASLLPGTTLELLNDLSVTLGAGDKLDFKWNTSTSKWEESGNTFMNMLFKGGSGAKNIFLNDNQADALSFAETTNKYLTFITTDTFEEIKIFKDLELVNNAFLVDDKYLRFGNTLAVNDASLGWNTAQTVDGLYLGLATAQNTLIIAEEGDKTFDFTHGAQTNPTLFIHSAIQSTTQYVSLAHNQTDGVITLGTGMLTLNSSAFQLNKLGTATVGNPVYNSPDVILQSSVWDTDGSEDTWKFKWRNIPTSAASTTANMRLYSQKNAAGEVQVLNIDNGGALTSASSLNSSTGVVQSATTAMTVKGWATDGATADGVILDAGAALTVAGANLVSIRNNNVEKAYVDYLGSFNAGSGTAALPAFSFVGDPNTGFWNYAGDTIGVASAGANVGTIGTGSTLDFNTFRAFNNVVLTLSGRVTDGATAVNVQLQPVTVYTTAGAKLLSIWNGPSGNGGVEKLAIDKDGSIIFSAGAGRNDIKSAPVAGVARTIAFDIPIIAGGAANNAVDFQFQLDSVAEAGLYGETDGAGSYRGAVWKIPYQSADFGIAWASVSFPVLTVIPPGSQIALHNTNGAGADRIYTYMNGVWRTSGDLT